MSTRIESTTSNQIEDFFFARRLLSRNSVVNLLLSSSFGINALLYAAWLGYLVGLWALLIQAGWALSFYLLGRYADNFSQATSLHDLLGSSFVRNPKLLPNKSWRLVAWFVILIAWEVSVGKSMLNSLPGTALTPTAIAWIMGGIVLLSLTYSLQGGLRSNATVNIFTNGIKISVVFVLVLSTLILLTRAHTEIWTTLLPSFGVVIERLGWFGLTTNIIFNLAWQFVDNSSWQSVVAGSNAGAIETKHNLRLSGLTVFLTIGFLGTLLGAAFTTIANLTPDNILIQSIKWHYKNSSGKP